MADEETRTLADLKIVKRASDTPEAAAPEEGNGQKLDAQGRAYATGKRKDAIARV